MQSTKPVKVLDCCDAAPGAASKQTAHKPFTLTSYQILAELNCGLN